MAKLKTPILSIGMIVKNEIRCIEKCIDALKPLREAISCELVIADTGSTDGTRQIAKENADIFFDFEWINDFSAARNAVLDKCSGIWHIAIDADEYLDKDIKELVSFLKGKKATEYNSAYYTIRNYKSYDIENSEFVLFNALRLIKLDTGIRYEGEIHEAFMLKDIKLKSYQLNKTIFHHDGYASSTEQETQAKKLKYDRNMKLLSAKLEKSPSDKVLLQCIESSIEKADKVKYSLIALERIEKRDFKAEDNSTCVVFCRAVSVLLSIGHENAEIWLGKLEEYFPNSSLLHIDVAYIAMQYFNAKSDFEKIIKYTQRYNIAIEKFEKNELNSEEFKTSSLSFFSDKNKLFNLLIMVRAYFMLKEENNAIEMLEKLDFDALSVNINEVDMFLKCITALCNHYKIAKVASRLFDKVSSLTDDNDINNKIKNLINSYFVQAINKSDDERTWQVFTETKGDYGIASQIIMSNYADEINALIKKVEAFENLPTRIYYKFIELSIDMPTEFYNLPIITKSNIAFVLSTYKNCSENLIAWVKSVDFEKSLVKLSFAYDITYALLQRENLSTYNLDILCKLWTMLSEIIITKTYDENFRKTKNNWTIVQSSHYLSLVTLYCKELLLSDSDLLFVQTLRKSLETIPLMNNFIKYLLDNGARLYKMPPTELANIANQVKTILKMYPKDNPTVMQILSSDVYMNVAHLIEFTDKEEIGF